MQAVFFFIPFPDRPDIAANYLQYLAATLRINRKYFKKTLLYSSEATTFPANLRIDEVIRLPSQYQDFPHFMRVMSWLHYLDSDCFDTDTVFLDADVVVNRELNEVFENDFALAFTARPSTTYSCIDTGVIFARRAEKRVAIAHAEGLFRIAELVRLQKDLRYPNVEFAGIWGGDELCAYLYLNNIAAKRNTTLREVVTAVSFDEFKSFGEGISFFGGKFNVDYRNLSESEWNTPLAIHFPGVPKTKLFEYCERRQLDAPW